MMRPRTSIAVAEVHARRGFASRCTLLRWGVLDAVCVFVATSPAAARTRFQPAIVKGGVSAATVAVTLVNPASGGRVARSQHSPVFTWRVDGLASLTSPPSEKLEVSTDPTFRGGVATQIFDCTSSGCPTSYQWKTSWWYLESDACTYTPPQGRCSKGTTLSNTLYWRVSLPLSDGPVVSPTGHFQLFRPKDTTPPHALALRGSAQRGAFARFEFFASDETGPIREELGLYGRGRLVFRGRSGWRILPNQAYLRLQLPLAIQAGTYTWRLTAFDQAGNHKKSCALYVIGA